MKLFRRKVKANRGPATNEVPSNETPAVASKDIERVEADAVQVTPSGSARPVDVFDLLDQMFAEWSGLVPPHRSGPSGAGWPATALIRVDQMMQNSELVVRAELPGIDPEKDIELTVSDGHLHIEGERREEDRTERAGYLRQELRYGAFRRSLPLPGDVAASDIAATYRDGILEVRIPMAESTPVRKIPIAKAS